VTRPRVGQPRFDFQQAKEVWLFPKSRLAVGPTKPLFKWVTNALTLEVKLPGREANQPLSACAIVKSEWSDTSFPRMHSWCARRRHCLHYHSYCGTAKNRMGTYYVIFRLSQSVSAVQLSELLSHCCACAVQLSERLSHCCACAVQL